MSELKHPIQPIYKDKQGTFRFKQNDIVLALLSTGSLDMNKIAMLPFSTEDREQFAQLIGYSLSGFSELSYASDKVYGEAYEQAQFLEMKEQEYATKDSQTDDEEIISCEQCS